MRSAPAELAKEILLLGRSLVTSLLRFFSDMVSLLLWSQGCRTVKSAEGAAPGFYRNTLFTCFEHLGRKSTFQILRLAFQKIVQQLTLNRMLRGPQLAKYYKKDKALFDSYNFRYVVNLQRQIISRLLNSCFSCNQIMNPSPP